MEFKNLLIETTDGITTLTINRPQVLNSLTSEVVQELECALYGLDLDASVKAAPAKRRLSPGQISRRCLKYQLLLPMTLPVRDSA